MIGHVEEEKIALLAGGDLKAKEAHDLAGHMATCPACSARLKAYQAQRGSFAALREAGLGKSDFDQVRRSVLYRLQEKRAPRFWLGTPLRWGALAAGIVMIVALGAWWRARMPVIHVSRAQVSGSALTTKHNPELIKATTAEKVKPTTQAIKHRGIAKSAVTASHTTVHVPQSGGQPAFAQIVSSLAAPVESKPVLDRIAIKLETPDPNVIIIWLASSEEKIK